MEASRRAEPGDVGRLADLAREAVAELAPLRGGTLFVAREARGEPFEDTFRAELADADRAVWVGTYHEHVVGYATGRIERLRDGHLLGVIGDLYVEEPAREVGVGEALMDALLAWFREKGCDGVDAHALPGTRQTKNFFEGSGFSARLLVMHRRLTDDAS